MLMFALGVGTAQAAPTKSIVVSPAYQEATISATQPSKLLTVTYFNRTGNDHTFKLSTADFGSLDESGGVLFLGQPANELEHRYGLASWMQLGTDTLFLPAGSSKQLTVTIENRTTLAPGGHYGVVMATAVGDPARPGESGADVGVRQVITSLVLLTKDGGGDPQLKLVSQSLNANLWKLPSTADLRFQNTGNVHVTPYGTIEVKDPLGTVVERSALNEGSVVILPESFRKLKSSFMPIHKAVWPGRYTITTSYRYDGTDTSTVTVTHTWYVGIVIVWGTIAAILLALAGLLWWLIRRLQK